VRGWDATTGAWTETEFRAGRLAEVRRAVAPKSAPPDDFISPGWIDLQINGLAGVNFGDPDLSPSAMRTACERLWACGVTHFLPTLITDDLSRMERSLSRLAAARRDPELGRSLLGFHLEGPFLSTEDGPRGAHPLVHCRPPSWDDFRRLQDAAEGGVRLMTLAPELPGAISLVEKLVAAGVLVSIGHTAASRDDILAAASAGARMATHLGNAAHDMLQRHRNYVYDQLGDDRLFASLIVDGHHLPAHLVRSFVRAKGLERTVLVSDAVQYAGLPPGVYDGGYRKFEVRADGYIGVAGEPRMAGSGIMLHEGVANVCKFAGVDLGAAVRMVTANPAAALGVSLGRLEPGAEASLVRFRHDAAAGRISILETIVAGETRFRAG
jgi:N-acetylglucosamine-6-phosphate deacetylase